MMTSISHTAMVLAAGFGKRMHPLTLHKPKPLFEVGGKTMLDHALDKLKSVGITHIIVNCHYLADQIKEHVVGRKDLSIIVSHEPEILDTGGGVKKMVSAFGDKPFFVLNADLPWLDNGTPSLEAMARYFDPALMDVLLLVMEREKALGFDGRGDFNLSQEGHLARLSFRPPYSHVFVSAQITTPRLYEAVEETIFSNTRIWDTAEKKARLYGIPHRGTCYHVGTQKDLERANALLTSGKGWAVGAE